MTHTIAKSRGAEERIGVQPAYTGRIKGAGPKIVERMRISFVEPEGRDTTEYLNGFGICLWTLR